MAKHNEAARAALNWRPNFAPTGIGGPEYVYGGTYNVGGGIDQANLNLQAAQEAHRQELSRQQMGMGLMQNIQETMRDPFSIVPALQMYGQAGGGTLAPAVALSQSGGRGAPSPYGAIADRLMRGLSEFSGATPINPATGAAFNPMEMDYLRTLTGKDLLSQGYAPKQISTDLARSEPNLNRDLKSALKKKKAGAMKSAGNYMKSSKIKRTA